MRVQVDEREYTLYTEANGTWTMHTFNLFGENGHAWIASDYNVSQADPFASTVTYDAWR